MFDDLTNKNDTFKGPTKDEYKRFKQKDHNERQKRFAKSVGENFASFALLAILALVVGSIWTEARIFTDWNKFIGDAVVSVTLYILADVCASYIGTQGGKLDDDYIRLHVEYLELRSRVRTAGIVLMDMFCDWQIDVEYEYYLRRRCKDLKIDYKEYIEKYHGKTLEELQAMFPLEKLDESGVKRKLFAGVRNVKTSSKAARVFALNQIEHIDLTPDILLTDGKVKNHRGNVSMSGEEYVEKHTVGKTHIAITALVAILVAIPVFTLAQEFTIGAVIYTIFKLALMLFRMYSGYSRGAKAFNTVEPKHLQDKMKYLYLYLEFLDKKIYETLGDKYNVVGVEGNKGSGEKPDGEPDADGNHTINNE